MTRFEWHVHVLNLNLEYTPVNWHSNGKWTIWRFISYNKRELSIAMLLYRRVHVVGDDVLSHCGSKHFHLSAWSSRRPDKIMPHIWRFLTMVDSKLVSLVAWTSFQRGCSSWIFSNEAATWRCHFLISITSWSESYWMPKDIPLILLNLLLSILHWIHWFYHQVTQLKHNLAGRCFLKYLDLWM